MGSPTFAADKRYIGRVIVLTILYLGAMFAASRLIRDGQVEGLPAFLLAILPGLFLAATFVALGRMIVEEKDEYRRMLLVRQTLIATGFTLSAITVWGHMELFGFVPQFDAFYIVILWAIGLVIGGLYNLRTLAPAEAE